MKIDVQILNRVTQLDPSRLLYKAFTVNYDLAIQGQTTWVSSFEKNTYAVKLYQSIDKLVPVSFTAYSLPLLFKQSSRNRSQASGSKLTTYLTLFGEHFESFEMRPLFDKGQNQKWHFWQNSGLVLIGL